MIEGAMHHFRGIGPVRLGQLHEAGIRTWQDVLQQQASISETLRAEVVQEAERCLEALEQDDIPFFVERLFPHDRWRILNRYIDRCSFFDIETTGLEYDDTITMVVCWHKDRLHTFIEHENLDDFLDLLDDVDLLVSFNGSTFDVPRVLDGFHIPELPCPHFDLRWPCYHKNLSGGLKQVTARLGIDRPDDLQDVDGSLAVVLWNRWLQQRDEAARQQLIRYCGADVMLLKPLSQVIGGHRIQLAEDFWDQLPASVEAPAAPSLDDRRRQFLTNVFGTASPTRLRTRR
ncbi:MAG: ribonuclease H-like domain-containing protein [Planctomycetaceae bacterium]|nr:ribonuclease H-like domain-containing protein [Planctomycetaceae bacterium]